MLLSTRSFHFWCIAFFGFIGGLFVTSRYFSTAFPLVNLNVTMDRQAAVEKARTICIQQQLGPDTYHAATDFDTDIEVQTYIELEAGGKNTLTELMKNHWYELYIWRVRHFKQYDPHEVIIFFTPEGNPYGFNEKIPEKLPGAALSPDTARMIGEATAQDAWFVDLSPYQLVETKKEERLSGRIDYTFVYEHQRMSLKEGKYRVSISVSGDRCTAIERSIKVPKDFTLRYQGMRSTNKNIAWVAHLLMMILYVFGCGIFGTVFLAKNNLSWIKPAVACGALIAFGTTLIKINSLPLLWMDYNTARSIPGFILDLISGCAYSFLYNFIFFSFICLIAEGLSRAAFGNQIQLWRIWNLKSAASLSVLGRTIGGYLIVGFDLAVLILFYILTTRYFGWWIPSQSLIDPNVLATYFPWFSSLANSIQAGFIEECLYRAIPLASAALIGRKVGKERLCIGIAFALQVIVFGAAHATYASLPAYSRLIELIIPSCIFGGLYLLYGLLPAILAHVTYDVFWFALPLFVSSAPDAWKNQAIVIFLTGIPLWIVLYQRIKAKSWEKTVPEYFLNKNWIAPTVNIKNNRSEAPVIHNPISTKKMSCCIIIGLTLLASWLLFIPKGQDTIANSINRKDAIARAKKIFSLYTDNDISIWTPLSSFTSSFRESKQSNIEQRFVWQVLGKETYKKLLDAFYLFPPHWTIRFARFSGSSIEREEEFSLCITGTGDCIQFEHHLPESRPGASLSEDDARSKALAFLKKEHNLNPSDLIEISALANKEPARTDWTFIFNNKTQFPLKEGQARIRILISGDELSGFRRYIHVPEEWKRTESNILSGQESFYALFFLIGLVCFISLFIWCSRSYLFPKCTKHFLAYLTLAIFFVRLIGVINAWPANSFFFSTAMPYVDQLFRLLTGQLLSIASRVFFGCILLGRLITLYQSQSKTSVIPIWITGLASGIGIGTIIASIKRVVILEYPCWLIPDIYNRYMPLYTALVYAYSHLFIVIVTLLIPSLIVHQIYQKKGSTWIHFIKSIPVFILATLLYLCSTQNGNISLWATEGITSGCLLAIVYSIFLRYDHSGIIPIATGITLISIAEIILANGMLFEYIVAFCALIGTSLFLTNWYRKNAEYRD